MPHGIETTVFVGPRVEGRKIMVVDFFVVDDPMMELDGVGPSPEEWVSGLEPGHEPKGIHETAHGVVTFLCFFPFTLPLDDDAVAHGEPCIFFALGGFVDAMHGRIAHLVTRFVAVRVTLSTPMPKTPWNSYTTWVFMSYSFVWKVLSP